MSEDRPRLTARVRVTSSRREATTARRRDFL